MEPTGYTFHELVGKPATSAGIRGHRVRFKHTIVPNHVSIGEHFATGGQTILSPQFSTGPFIPMKAAGAEDLTHSSRNSADSAPLRSRWRVEGVKWTFSSGDTEKSES
jgi:hypothetical protein